MVACCAGLPLALGIVAARATRQPRFPLMVLAGELRDRSRLLDILDPGDPDSALRAVLSWSADALSDPARASFGLLGLVPGPDISLAGAAALFGQPMPTAQTVLRELDDQSLVRQHAPDRYRMHDLVRLYAAEYATHHHAEAGRDTALRRLVDHYVRTAHEWAQSLPLPLPGQEPGPVVTSGQLDSPADEIAALDWFAAEHACLLAAQRLAAERGWHDRVWQLAKALDPFHLRQGHPDSQLTAARAGLAAAECLGDPATLASAHGTLGHACTRLGLRQEALTHLSRALSLAEQSGDPVGQAFTHFALAWEWGQRDDDRQALRHAADALRLFRTLGSTTMQGWALTTMGWHHARVGEHDQARSASEAALGLHCRNRDGAGEAAAQDSLGHAAHRAGQPFRAVHHYRRAIVLRRANGNTYLEADTLLRLGEVYAELDRPGPATRAWTRAIDLYRTQRRDMDADALQRRLDTLGDPGQKL